MRLRRAILIIVAGMMLAMAVPAGAVAAPPGPEAGPFVCPSVSLKNPNAMWVIGDHGAYFVLIPTRGSTGEKIFVKEPKNMEAQTTAGFGLYKSYPSYPTYVTQMGDMGAMLLVEGLHWFGLEESDDPMAWGEGDMLMIHDNGDGTYDVSNMGMMGMMDKGTMTIESPVPLYSALFW
ncbi:MAG: hypothetical protein RQ731_07545 [Anaerosomatales bacterium]|nr:hypothetical protein [Anaerosomatales bacterium]MDT8434590.1 hypothetical protein [Anaerosomatales bacterium]